MCILAGSFVLVKNQGLIKKMGHISLPHRDNATRLPLPEPYLPR